MPESQQGESRRIIIDAKETVKIVEPVSFEKTKTEVPQIETETKKEDPANDGFLRNLAEDAIKGLGGALVVETAETIHERFKEYRNKERFRGHEDEKQAEENKGSYNFAQIESALSKSDLSNEDREFFTAIRERRIKDFQEVDEGDFVRDTEIAFKRILKNNDWDEVFEKLNEYGDTREHEMRSRNEIDDRLNGIAKAAVRYESARVIGAGLAVQRRNLGKREFRNWMSTKDDDVYSPESVKRLEELSSRRFVNLAGDLPEKLVGKNVKSETDPIVNESSQIQDLNRKIRDLEESLHNNVRNPFGSAEDFARAMGVSDPALQKELYLRAEMKMIPIPSMDLDVPRFLIQSGHAVDIAEQQERWKARSRLSNAAAFKRMSPSYDKVFPNQELIDLSKDNFETLLKIDGVVEAASLYTAMLTMTEKVRNKKGELKTVSLNPNRLLDSTGLSDSIFSIRSEGDFNNIRLAVREWCQTNLGITEEAAVEAEQIAWNTIYISGMVEEYDSKSKHPEIPGRVPPIIGTFKSLPFWMLMHPQERLEAKVRGKEAWSRAGEWALNRPGLFKVPEILPITVFHNALKDIKLENPRNSKKKESLFDIFDENGKELVKSGQVSRSVDDINIESLSEGPFGTYCFDSIAPSITILSLIDKGLQKDTQITKVGDAFRKLDIPNKQRENILIVSQGLDAKSFSLKPAMGWSAWKYLKRGYKVYAPNLFK